LKDVKTNYIIGIGRSGTSLLMSLLGAHPSIHTTPENYFSIFLSNAFQNKMVFSPQDIRLIHRFNIAFGKLQPYVAFNYVINDASDLLNNGFKGTYLELCKEIYLSFQHTTLQNKEVSTIIDKNPSNTLFTDKLLKSNPEAKFILMIRDYRANILSRKKKTLNKSGNIIFNAFLCRLFFKEINSFRSNKNCLLVRYEDLVSNQVETLTSICQFLNIEFEQNLIGSGIQKDISSNVESEKSEKFIKEHFSELKNPVHAGNTEKWKTELSAEEIEICDTICSNEAISLGYSPISSGHKSYFSLLIRNLPKFLKACYNVKKERILYYLPIGMKLKRLNQKI
jgi:hypothetical protein